jgi:hypothetical protein
MNTLNAILHTQEAMATKLTAIEQTLQHIQGVHGTTRQLLETTPYFTYEMFTDYLTTKLACQLEEKTRLAPILLELRYLLSIVITYIINVKLTYSLDLFVR